MGKTSKSELDCGKGYEGERVGEVQTPLWRNVLRKCFNNLYHKGRGTGFIADLARANGTRSGLSRRYAARRRVREPGPLLIVDIRSRMFEFYRRGRRGDFGLHREKGVLQVSHLGKLMR